MLVYPNIDPVAISLGPLKVHWYGLMYLVAFGSAWWLGTLRAKRAGSIWSKEEVSDLIFYGALGVVLGGRLGYMFFYNFSELASDPLSLFRVWEGGMSFHGGLLGVLVAMWWFGHRRNKTFFQVTDFVAPLVPLGYFAGRMGNFINGELWGRPASSDLPWAMVFPHVDQLPRHPSMLYQGLLEGLVLFVVLWIYSSKHRPTMAVSGAFLLGMGVFRIIDESFRQPDAHIGFLAFQWLTMGQLLSFPMVIFGVILIALAYRKNSVKTVG